VIGEELEQPRTIDPQDFRLGLCRHRRIETRSRQRFVEANDVARGGRA